MIECITFFFTFIDFTGLFIAIPIPCLSNIVPYKLCSCEIWCFNHLIMVLHQLYDNFNLSVEVFNWDDSHDIGCIFLIRILTILIGQHQTSISCLYLQNTQKTSLYSSVSIVLWQTIPLTMKNSSHSLFISSLLQIQYFNQWSGYNWPLLIRCIWIPISTCMFSLTPYFMTVMYNYMYLNKQEGRMRLDQSNMFIFM